MKEISRSLKKYLDTPELQSDFREQVASSKLLLAVLQRFILDGYEAAHVEQLKMPTQDRDATLHLMRTIGEQRVLRKMAKLFSAFGLDDHPLIKAATHISSVSKETTDV